MKENYLEYAEQDTTDTLQNITANAFDVVTMSRNETTYLTDDKGVAAIGDFNSEEAITSIDVDARALSKTGDPASLYVWAIANSLSYINNVTPNVNFRFNVAGTGDLKIILQDAPYVSADDMDYTFTTWYYFRITRTGAVVTVKVFDADTRLFGDLIDTLEIVTAPTNAMRYLYAVASQDTDQANALTGEIANLEMVLAEEVRGAIAPPIKSVISAPIRKVA